MMNNEFIQSIPTTFQHATTISFWLSIMSLFLKKSLLRNVMHSYIFATSITGIYRQYNKNEPTIIKQTFITNFVQYVIPLMISLCSDRDSTLSWYLIVPFILYNLYLTYYKNKNNKNLYGEYTNTYCLLIGILVIFYNFL